MSVSILECEAGGRAALPAGRAGRVLDCGDLERAAAFWTTVPGYRREGYGGGRYLSLVPQGVPGVELLLQRTGDYKSEKNRVHLDCGLPTLTSRSRACRRPAV